MRHPNRLRDPLPTRIDDVPPLPDAFHEALARGLRDLDLELAPAARAAIEGHARLLVAWMSAINLSAIRDPAEIARLHVLDSLAGLVAVAPGGSTPRRLLDLGSGGGYPGLPLAAVLSDTPVVLIDSVAKKVRFLETAIRATGLSDRAEAVVARSEELAVDSHHRATYDIVVVRAVGDLAELVELALPLLVPGGRLVAWKRGRVDDEIATARPAITMLGGGRVEQLATQVHGLAGHVLVVLHKDRPTPAGFPRDPATRRRHPL